MVCPNGPNAVSSDAVRRSNSTAFESAHVGGGINALLSSVAVDEWWKGDVPLGSNFRKGRSRLFEDISGPELLAKLLPGIDRNAPGQTSDDRILADDGGPAYLLISHEGTQSLEMPLVDFTECLKLDGEVEVAYHMA